MVRLAGESIREDLIREEAEAHPSRDPSWPGGKGEIRDVVLSRSRATLSRRDGTSGFPLPFSRGKSRQGKPYPWSFAPCIRQGPVSHAWDRRKEGQAMVTLPVSGKQVNGLDGARCEATTKCVAHYPLTVNLSKWSLSVVRLSVVDLTIEPSKPTRVKVYQAPLSRLLGKNTAQDLVEGFWARARLTLPTLPLRPFHSENIREFLRKRVERENFVAASILSGACHRLASPRASLFRTFWSVFGVVIFVRFRLIFVWISFVFLAEIAQKKCKVCEIIPGNSQKDV